MARIAHRRTALYRRLHNRLALELDKREPFPLPACRREPPPPAVLQDALLPPPPAGEAAGGATPWWNRD